MKQHLNGGRKWLNNSSIFTDPNPLCYERNALNLNQITSLEVMNWMAVKQKTTGPLVD